MFLVSSNSYLNTLSHTLGSICFLSVCFCFFFGFCCVCWAGVFSCSVTTYIRIYTIWHMLASWYFTIIILFFSPSVKLFKSLAKQHSLFHNALLIAKNIFRFNALSSDRHCEYEYRIFFSLFSCVMYRMSMQRAPVSNKSKMQWTSHTHRTHKMQRKTKIAGKLKSENFYWFVARSLACIRMWCRFFIYIFLWLLFFFCFFQLWK